MRNEFQPENRDDLHMFENFANAENLMSDRMLLARPFVPRANLPGDFMGQNSYQQAAYDNGNYSPQRLFQTLSEQISFMNEKQAFQPSLLEKLISP